MSENNNTNETKNTVIDNNTTEEVVVVKENKTFNIKLLIIAILAIILVILVAWMIALAVGKKNESNDKPKNESVLIAKDNYDIFDTEELILDVDSLSVTDLENIKKLENLKKIDIRNVMLDDISFLSDLKKLNIIKIAVTPKITNFDILKNFDNLFTLEIYGNIGTNTDMSAFTSLDKISTLALTFKTMKTYSFLNEMSGLSSLSLDCDVEEYSEISILLANTKIKIIPHGNLAKSNTNDNKNVVIDGIIKWSSYDVDATEIITINIPTEYSDQALLQSELNKLVNYKNLKSLTIKTDDNNANPYSINNLAFLKDLKFLESLTLMYLNVSDMSALSNLINLKTLNISYGNMAFSKFSSISNLVNLEELDLSMQNITNLSFLSKLTKVKKLYLSGNNITDINPLKSMVVLNELYLGCNNNLKNFEPLTNLTTLNTLMITPEDINLSIFSKLTNLKTLYMSTEFRDETEFKELYPKISLNLVSECV